MKHPFPNSILELASIAYDYGGMADPQGPNSAGPAITGLMPGAQVFLPPAAAQGFVLAQPAINGYDR
jgi:hypothetical protein